MEKGKRAHATIATVKSVASSAPLDHVNLVDCSSRTTVIEPLPQLRTLSSTLNCFALSPAKADGSYRPLMEISYHRGGSWIFELLH
jgi:hypothetical protein